MQPEGWTPDESVGARIDAVCDRFETAPVAANPEAAPPAPSAASGLPSVPGYEVQSLLGKGGMGVVYRARHLALGRAAAVKLLREGAHAEEGERERFRVEGRRPPGCSTPTSSRSTRSASAAGSRSWRWSSALTILIELQSQPDRLMMLRVLDYLVQVWKQQAKEHGERHGSLASVKLRPVLPVVLHTGSYRWEKLGTLLDLMDGAEGLDEFTPAFAPLFVSLPDTDEKALEEVGPFGQVLALTRARKATRAAIAGVLARTVERVSALKGTERLRRLELLSYVEAFVYHARGATEHDALRGRIDDALREDEARLEVEMARRTMADVHRDEASLNTARQTLLRQLRLRFGDLPQAHQQVIESATDLALVESWLDGFATAEGLDDIGILPG